MITKEKIDNFIKILKNENQKEFIKIKTKKSENLPLTVSKFGWLPFLEKNSKIPKTEDGKQLFLLAQINCEELPENNMYPKKWILQFWIFSDDLYGCDFDNPTANETKRIVYIENLENGFSESEIKEKYQPYFDEEWYSPFEDNAEFALTFEKDFEWITTSDYSFDENFAKKWNENFPENTIEAFWDCEEIEVDWIDDLWEYFYDNIDGDGDHKIWGYPHFTQEDPRTYDKNLQKYDTILLQIDSEYDDDEEKWNIIWWDVWVANFFISKENLEKLEFGEVLYNWDCS